MTTPNLPRCEMGFAALNKHGKIESVSLSGVQNTPPGGAIIRCTVVPHVGRENAEHDPHVVAAARAMREALILAEKELIQGHTIYFPKCPGNCPQDEALQKIRAALAKAEGKV